MTLFFYFLLAIGFFIGLVVLFSAMSDIRENNQGRTAQRDVPLDEQQHDVAGIRRKRSNGK